MFSQTESKNEKPQLVAALSVFAKDISTRTTATESKNADEIKVATQVLKNIKAITTSSNDILARSLLPIIYGDEIDLYKKQFGENTINELLKQFDFLSTVRDLTAQIIETMPVVVSPMTTQCVVPTLLGVGECQETTNLASAKLIAAGVKHVHMLGIKGMSREGFASDDYYDHAFVIIGDISSLKPGCGLNKLDNLNDTCIVLDPFLNIVGKANQYNQLAKDYLSAYKMDEVNIITDVPDKAIDQVPIIMKQAEDIVEKIKTYLLQMNIVIPTFKKLVTTENVALDPQENQRAQLKA